MTPLRIFILCILPVFCIEANAAIPGKPNFTPQQTKAEITRLTTGNDQRIQRTYRHGVLISEEWHQDWPIRYMKYFYPDGKLKSEGLMDSYQNVGTWHYYNKQGKLVKIADYNSMTQQLFNGYTEPHMQLLNRMSAQADAYMVAHFGQAFLDSNHVRCEHKYYATDSTQEAEWMDLPFGKPCEFTFDYTMTVHDSLEFDLLYLRINRDGTYSSPLWGMPPCADSSNTCNFKVQFDDAMKIAAQYPFTERSYPRLSASESGYHWILYGPSTGTPNESTYRVLSIDAATAAIDTFMQTSWCDHCEPVVYKKYYKDSTPIAPGDKVIYAEGIYLNVPETWIELENYGKRSEYSDDLTWYDNGDTLRLRTSYGYEDRLKPVALAALDYNERLHRKPAFKHMPDKMKCMTPDCQRKVDSLFSIDSLRIMHYNDSIQFAYEREEARAKAVEDSIQEVARQRQLRAMRKQQFEDSLCRAFVGSFPDSLVQGRHVELHVTTPGDDNKYWSIEMEINNAHGGFGVMQTNYYFAASHLTEEQFYRFYAIFKTARFLSYK